MSYHHITLKERTSIEIFLSIGYSNRIIAKELKRHPSSIDREIKRGSKSGKYFEKVATERHIQRRKASKPKGKWTKKVAKNIVEKLELAWSPEQIANTETLGKVSFKAIYNWLYLGKLATPLSVFRRKGKSRNPAEKRGKFLVGTPISQRPKEVQDRKAFGHWELGTMVSSRGKSKGCFATFVERKSRLYTALKMPNRNANSMFNAISQLHNLLPQNSFQTATTDRGKEFACYPDAELLGIKVYFEMHIPLGKGVQ